MTVIHGLCNSNDAGKQRQHTSESYFLHSIAFFGPVKNKNKYRTYLNKGRASATTKVLPPM